MSHNFVKVRAINIKLESIVSEVNPGLCAKFRKNRPIGGATNTEKSGDVKFYRIRTKFGERDLEALTRPGVKFRDVWSKWA